MSLAKRESGKSCLTKVPEPFENVNMHTDKVTQMTLYAWVFKKFLTMSLTLQQTLKSQNKRNKSFYGLQTVQYILVMANSRMYWRKLHFLNCCFPCNLAKTNDPYQEKRR